MSKKLGHASRRAGLTFAHYDEPTWALLLVIAIELGIVAGLLAVLVLR